MYENEIFTGQDNMNQAAGPQPVKSQLAESQRVESQAAELQPMESQRVVENTGSVSAGAETETSTYFDYISSPRPVEPEPTKSADNGSKASLPKIEKAEGKKNKRADKDNPGEKSGIFRKFVLSVSLGLCFGLFAGLGFYAVQLGTGQLDDQGEQEQQVEASGNNVVLGDNEVVSSDLRQAIKEVLSDYGYINQIYASSEDFGDASDVVKQVMPAMVSIINNYTSTSTFWGQTYTQKERASGSGIIVAERDEELLIVTNNHVVEGTDSLEVTFIDGSTAEAVIKGLDVDMDLAVIAVRLSKLSEDTKEAITIATLGNSDDLELGERVIAIGNALGYGQSVSGGMVSALARELTFDDGSTGLFIQTDAAINPGNSGGALLNMKGEVIGINSSKIGGTYVEGMGYAIPITSASPIIAELMDRQTREQKVADSERGYLGVTLQLLSASTAEMYGMPQGAYILSVEEDSAAAKAGLLKGDIIVSFDGQRISSTDELTGAMEYYRAGETVKMTIKRIIDGEYQSVELQVTLGKRP